MNNDLINMIGFFACAIAIYAGIESSLFNNKKKKALKEKEKMYKAKKALTVAVRKRMEEKKFKNH